MILTNIEFGFKMHVIANRGQLLRLGWSNDNDGFNILHLWID